MPLPVNPILSDIQDQFLNSTPLAAFFRQFGGQISGAPNQNYRKFLQGLDTDFYNQYLGKVADDPNLRYTDFLGQQDPMAMFRQLAPSQRGERPGQFAPKLTWRTGVGW